MATKKTTSGNSAKTETKKTTAQSSAKTTAKKTTAQSSTRAAAKKATPEEQPVKAAATKKQSSPVTEKATQTLTITEEDVRIKAEKIYLERVNKGIPGDAESDWLQAEKELGLK